MIQKSVSLKYEPSSEPLHISDGVRDLVGSFEHSHGDHLARNGILLLHTRHKTVSLSAPERAAHGGNNDFTEMCSGFEAGSYLMLIDFCITQL